MKNYIVVCSRVIVMAVLLIVLPAGSAVSADETAGLWVGMGIGKSSLGRPCGEFNLNYRRGVIIFGLRGTASTGGSYKVEDCDAGYDCDDAYDELKDLALVAGVTHSFDRVLLSLAAGVAGVKGTFHELIPGSDDIYEKGKYETAIGLPFEAQAIWMFSDKAAIGLYGYYNLNRNRNFGGLCFSLMFGSCN